MTKGKEIITSSKAHRDKAGRFLKGSPGGPGRKLTALQGQGYLNVVMANCSLEEWGEVTRRAVEDAIEGNWRAREWLSKYLVRGAVTTVDAKITDGMDRETGEKIRRLQAVIANVLPEVLGE